MSYYFAWRPYISAAAKRRNAEREVAKLKISRAVARTGPTCASTSRRCSTGWGLVSTRRRSCFSCCAASMRTNCWLPPATGRWTKPVRSKATVLQDTDMAALFGVFDG